MKPLEECVKFRKNVVDSIEGCSSIRIKATLNVEANVEINQEILSARLGNNELLIKRNLIVAIKNELYGDIQEKVFASLNRLKRQLNIIYGTYPGSIGSSAINNIDEELKILGSVFDTKKDKVING